MLRKRRRSKFDLSLLPNLVRPSARPLRQAGRIDRAASEFRRSLGAVRIVDDESDVTRMTSKGQDGSAA